MIGDKKKLAKALHEDSTEGAKVIKILSRNKYYEMCLLAIQHNESDVLRELLRKNKGFYLSSFIKPEEEDCKRARNLIKAANASSDPVSLLSVLYDTNKKTGLGKLTDKDFLNEDTPLEFIQSLLEKSPSLFFHCVTNIGLHSMEKLKFILVLSAGIDGPQPTLDAVLAQVAASGDIEQAKILLEYKADPNHDSGQALFRASQDGHREMVDLLLPFVKLDLYGNYITTLLMQKSAPDDIVSSIKTATENFVNKTVTETPPAPSFQDGFHRLNDDALAEVLTLPNGSTLITLFNFSSRQQDKFVTNEAGIISPFPTVNFDAIAKDVTKAMRTKLDALNNEKTASRPAINKLSLRSS